jgi:DNA-binding NtrC family response regulator
MSDARSTSPPDDATRPTQAGRAEADPPIDADWPELDTLKLRYIQRVLIHCQQHRGRAAKVLGVSRNTLTRVLAREQRRSARRARPCAGTEVRA